MKSKNWVWVLFVVGSAILPGTALADATYQVGGAFSCPNNSCLGGAYTLQFVGDNAGNTFQVTLTATTPNSTSGSPAFGDYISSVEFGDGKSISSASLVTSGAPGGAADWSPTVYGNLNNSGCKSGPAPNVCNNQVLIGNLYTLAKADGSTYSWTWTVTYATNGLDLNPADMHIGLQYSNQQNTSNGLIVSESGASKPLPEPGSLGLLGTGITGALFFFRKQR